MSLPVNPGHNLCDAVEDPYQPAGEAEGRFQRIDSARPEARTSTFLPLTLTLSDTSTEEDESEQFGQLSVS